MGRYEIGGTGDPDMGTVDDLARLALAAHRLGATVTLEDCRPELAELVWLAAVPVVVSRRSSLAVEVQREPEGGEEPLGIEEVQEEAHPGDLPT